MYKNYEITFHYSLSIYIGSLDITLIILLTIIYMIILELKINIVFY